MCSAAAFNVPLVGLLSITCMPPVGGRLLNEQLLGTTSYVGIGKPYVEHTSLFADTLEQIVGRQKSKRNT